MQNKNKQKKFQLPLCAKRKTPLKQISLIMKENTSLHYINHVNEGTSAPLQNKRKNFSLLWREETNFLSTDTHDRLQQGKMFNTNPSLLQLKFENLSERTDLSLFEMDWQEKIMEESQRGVATLSNLQFQLCNVKVKKSLYLVDEWWQSCFGSQRFFYGIMMLLKSIILFIILYRFMYI